MTVPSILTESLGEVAVLPASSELVGPQVLYCIVAVATETARVLEQ